MSGGIGCPAGPGLIPDPRRGSFEPTPTRSPEASPGGSLLGVTCLTGRDATSAASHLRWSGFREAGRTHSLGTTKAKGETQWEGIMNVEPGPGRPPLDHEVWRHQEMRNALARRD